MKRLISIILVALLVSYSIVAFIPTNYDPLWEDYLRYEEQFYKDRDTGLFD